jgi:hypothetical protein
MSAEAHTTTRTDQRHAPGWSWDTAAGRAESFTHQPNNEYWAPSK